MNVGINRNTIIILLLLMSISLVSANYNICNTDLSEPWFSIKDDSGNELIIIDNNGDVYFKGESHTPFDFLTTSNSIKIGDMEFSEFSSFFDINNFHYSLNDLNSYSGLRVKNNLGEIVTVFTNDSIYTKGVGLYEGSQGSCLSDGIYCSGSILENRDYYCDIEGDKFGFCKYNVVSSEDCDLKLSEDSDGGINYFNFGKVKDYSGCGSSLCNYFTYSDYCSGDNLFEYYVSGSGSSFSYKNCNDYEYNYCVGNDEVWRNNYGCGSGSCVDLPDYKVMNCEVSATEETTWTCNGYYQRVKTVTTYYPTCSFGTCGQTSIATDVYEDAPSGYYCSGGNWIQIKNCEGYWDYNYGTCSVSCGGGNYDKKFIVTQYPTVGGTSCPSPDFYDNGGNSCNTQSCCVSHSYKACGDTYHAYWYDSCGNREELILTCNADGFCADGYGTVWCNYSENN